MISAVFDSICDPKRNAGLGLLLLSLLLLVTPVDAIDVRPRGQRLLGIALTAENNDFLTAFQTARSAGLQQIELPLFWDQLEPLPGQFQLDLVDLANLFYSTQGVQISLTLALIDTNNLRLPPDLAALPFDDPNLIARFKALIDQVLAHLPDVTLTVLVIGNEVDIYLGDDPDQWQQFTTLFQQVRNHVRSTHPDLPVGSKATFEGLTGPLQVLAATLNASADWILATYYPLNPDSSVRPPTDVPSDLDRLTGLYPGRTMAMAEVGYPSSELVGSSEPLQAEFVRQYFSAWDAHAEQIVVSCFVWLTEISQQAVDGFQAYYGTSDPRFLAYLGSLGLRHKVGIGHDKPAYRVLKQQVALRGWSTDYLINSSAAGSWYDPARSGAGYIFDVIGNQTLVVYWFTYDILGNLLWLSGVGPITTDGAEIPMLQTSGGVFGPNLDPDSIIRDPWGTLSVRLEDCRKGNVSFVAQNPAFGSGSYQIIKLTGIAPELQDSCF